MKTMMNDPSIFELNPYHVRRLQGEILKIYVIFKDFCKRHDLRFYGLYGTVLGAVRHQGFIPWDDDMDVAMPRRDYERFLELIDDELPAEMKLVSYDRTLGYKNMFGKISLANTEVIKSVEDELGCRLPEGIYLDVFPLDGLPRSLMKRGWHLFRRAVLKAGQYSMITSCNNNHFGKKLVGCILRCVCSIFYHGAHSAKDYLDRHVSILKENDFYSSPYVSELGWITKEYRSLFKRHGLEADIWGDPKWVKFENTMVPIPARYERYLQFTYGDYMRLPPESKRIPSHCKLK